MFELLSWFNTLFLFLIHSSKKKSRHVEGCVSRKAPVTSPCLLMTRRRCPLLSCLLCSFPTHLLAQNLIWPDMSGKDGREMKEVKTKRSAETEGTEDVKKKKVEQPGKFSVSNCTVHCTPIPALLLPR